MSEISPLRPFHLSISCAGAFPVRTSAPPAREPDWLVSAPACFSRWPGSFASYDPDPASSSWRTSQRSILGGWVPYSGRWPRAGMLRDGECSELMIHWSAPRTGARGGSVSPGWPTPKTAGSGETPENWKRRAERVKNTPGSHGAPGMPLDVAVNWPTMTASEAKRGHGYQRAQGRIDPTLTGATGAAQAWPTPIASNHRSGKTSEATAEKNSRPLQERVERTQPGRLNPAWVEGLMGFPENWTLTDGLPLLDHNTPGSHRAPDQDSPTTETD